MRSILITGVAGFIGFNLAKTLIGKGTFIVGVDDFSSGSRSHVKDLLAEYPDLFSFIELDLGNLQESHLDGRDIDAIVHLGAQVSVEKSVNDPVDTLLRNINSTNNLIKLAEQIDVSNIVYASSCAVYGDNKNLPLGETAYTDALSLYAKTKLFNEVAFESARPALRRSTITGLRFFNVFGLHQDPSSSYAAVIPKWIKLARDGEDLTVFGDGFQTRDFVYVKDLCAAISLCLEFEGRTHDVFNVCTGTETDLLTLANEIIETFRPASNTGKSSLKFEDSRSEEVKHSCGSYEKLKSRCGWTPKYDLVLALTEMRDTYSKETEK